MTPLFTIITPSLQRESLIECCESVNSQTNTSWQHIVQCDCLELNGSLIERIKHPQREIYCCGVQHKNYGNTCRYLAWKKAISPWIIMLDDDNSLAHDRVLAQLSKVLTEDIQWAIFPILRFGHVFFNDPPGLCMTDTLNVVARREIARWPNIPDYTADGHWVEVLKEKYPYAAFPDFLPIGIMEKSNEGK